MSIPEDDRPPRTVKLHEFSPELAAIHDRLAELVALTFNVNSKSGGHKPSYAQRPETAAARLEAEFKAEKLDTVLGDWMA